MMRGESIVCFAKDHREDPTSNNHVMQSLARDNTVLWLNSVATRTPDLASRRDLGKIVTKLSRFVRAQLGVDTPGATEPREGAGLHVYTPLVLPFPHSEAATLVNTEILKSTVKRLRARLGMRPDFQLWTFLPTVAPYVDALAPSLVVYYCVDEWSEFSYVDGPRIAALERRLCQRADLVFATSRRLVDRKKELNPETHLASHGVDVEHFGKALRSDTVPAPELAALHGPVVGFVGLVEHWVDLDAIAYLAERRPEWNIVVVGRAMVDVARFRRPNVHFLGRKPYDELPRYLRRFDVGLVPFRVNELTRNMNPLKLREYLSAGVPVVSSDLPEVRPYADGIFGDLDGAIGCATYRSHEELLAHCEQALAADSPGARARRHRAMQAETWTSKIEALSRHVARVRAQKVERAGPRARPAVAASP